MFFVDPSRGGEGDVHWAMGEDDDNDDLRDAIAAMSSIVREVQMGPASPLCIVENSSTGSIQLRRATVSEASSSSSSPLLKLALQSVARLPDGQRTALHLLSLFLCSLLDSSECWAESTEARRPRRAAIGAVAASQLVLNAVDVSYLAALRGFDTMQTNCSSSMTGDDDGSSLLALLSSVTRPEVAPPVGDALARLTTQLLRLPSSSISSSSFVHMQNPSCFIAAVRGAFHDSCVVPGVRVRSDRVRSLQGLLAPAGGGATSISRSGTVAFIDAFSFGSIRVAAASGSANDDDGDIQRGSSTDDESAVCDGDNSPQQQHGSEFGSTPEERSGFEEAIVQQLLHLSSAMGINVVVTAARLPHGVVAYAASRGIAVIDAANPVDVYSIVGILGLQSAELASDGIITPSSFGCPSSTSFTAAYRSLVMLDGTSVVINIDATTASVPLRVIVLRTPVAELGVEYQRLIEKMISVAREFFYADRCRYVPGGAAMVAALKIRLDRSIQHDDSIPSVEARRVVAALSTALGEFIAAFAAAQTADSSARSTKRRRHVFEKFVTPLLRSAGTDDDSMMMSIYVGDWGAVSVRPARDVVGRGLIERASLLRDILHTVLHTAHQMMRVDRPLLSVRTVVGRALL